MSMKKIYVAIVEPSPVVQSGIMAMMSRCPSVEVVVAASAVSELVPTLRSGRIDVVIASTSLLSSLEAMPEVSSMPVIGMQSAMMDEALLKRFTAVATIYTSEEELHRIVSSVVEAPAEHNYAESHELSDRECDVLVLVARGLTNKEIASELNISPHTVISHRKNIAHKTGIRSAAGLAVYAVLNKLIDSDKL